VGFNYVSDETSGSKTECRDELDNRQLLSEDVLTGYYINQQNIFQDLPAACFILVSCLAY
jgi:hypothetical protein